MLVSWISKGIVESRHFDMAEKTVDPLKAEDYLPRDFKIENDTDELIEAIRAHENSEILTFDAECIENDSDYADLFGMFVAHARATNRITHIQSTFDHEANKATLSFELDGNHIEREWDQSSDWVSAKFCDVIDEIFPEHFQQRFVALPAQDQCAEFILLRCEESKDISTTFGLLGGNVDLDDELGSKITANIVVGFFGLLLTTGVGWALIGFWKALAISLVFWLIMTFRGWFKALREQEAQEQFAKDVEENPQIVSELALEFLEEVRKGRR